MLFAEELCQQYKQDSFLVGPWQPNTIGLPTVVGLWIFVRVWKSGI